jgi:excisionase family DNA binding protein
MPRQITPPAPELERQPLLVHISRAAEELSMSRRSVERLIEAGKIQAVGTRRLRRVLTRSLYDYIEQNSSDVAQPKRRT